MDKQYSRDRKAGVAAIGVLLAASVLTACGGGGGGSSGASPAVTSAPLVTPPAVQGLTTENFVQVAAVSLRNVFFFFEADTQSIASTIPGGLFLLGIAATLCESGSADVNINMPGGVTSMVGDTATIDYNNCVGTFVGGDQNRLNGRLDTELTRFSDSGLGNPFTITTQVTYSNNFTEETISGEDAGAMVMLEGQWQIAVDNNIVNQTTTLTASDYVATLTTAEGMRLTYQNLIQASEMLNVANNTYETESDYTLGLLTSLTDGSFIIDTTTPFTGIANMFMPDDNGIDEIAIFRPMSGALTITDSNGVVATLTAMTDGVSAEISLDLDGDTEADVTQIVTYETLDNMVDTAFGL